MSTQTLTKETIEVTNFVWSDGDNKLSAGDLLSTLITLSESEKETNPIADKTVADYLVHKGYIIPENNEFKINKDKKQDIVDLGNQVSNAIDKELENCIDKKIEPIPTILIMPVPIGINPE